MTSKWPVPPRDSKFVTMGIGDTILVTNGDYMHAVGTVLDFNESFGVLLQFSHVGYPIWKNPPNLTVLTSVDALWDTGL